jgi:hypothetical protein
MLLPVIVTLSILVYFGLPPLLALTLDDFVSYQRLAAAEYFAGTAVGIAGVEPPESKALRSLAAHRDGGSAFKYLLFTGSRAGKMYALVGLRHTNPLFFRLAVQPFRFLPGEVDTISGCVGRKMETRELVESSRQNPVRLKRGETLVQWWKRRTPGVELNIDILGGGYTSMFIDLEELRQPLPNAALEPTSSQPLAGHSTTLDHRPHRDPGGSGSFAGAAAIGRADRKARATDE